MSDLLLIGTLQTELDELSKRRKSLETDVLILEKKINVVDQKLKQSQGNEKMQSLKEFLLTEKERIETNKLSRVNLQAKILEEKLKLITNSQTNAAANFSQASNEEFIINTTTYFPKHHSEEFHRHVASPIDRKFQSFPPYRPHTSCGTTKKYCTYCEENVLNKDPSGKSSSISVDRHSHWSTSHLPLCMSMDICKECTAMKEFFTKMKMVIESDVIHKECTENSCYAFSSGRCDSPCDLKISKNSNANAIKSEASPTSKFEEFLTPFSKAAPSNANCMRMDRNDDNQEPLKIENLEIFREMIRNCESATSCADCAKLQAKYAVENNPTDEKVINSEDFDDEASITESILARCDSFAVCKCCKHNLLKIDMPTPSASIVDLVCTSHENCQTCAHVMETSRRNTMESNQNRSTPKIISHEILYNKSEESNKSARTISRTSSFLTVKRNSDDLSKYNPRRKLYDEIKREIEFQSQVIYKTQEEMSKLQMEQATTEELLKMRQILEKENLKLLNMTKLAKYEEKRLDSFLRGDESEMAKD